MTKQEIYNEVLNLLYDKYEVEVADGIVELLRLKPPHWR